MPDIFHDFFVKSATAKLFENIVTSKGLDNWWTKSSQAKPELGAVYTLNFGRGYIWKAIVRKYQGDQAFELEFTEADADWTGTRVGFKLVAREAKTEVHFYHIGWPEENDHFKISSYCWAMYLRILKRYTERGEQVPYEKRLDV